jgi:hypothetical protein
LIGEFERIATLNNGNKKDPAPENQSKAGSRREENRRADYSKTSLAQVLPSHDNLYSLLTTRTSPLLQEDPVDLVVIVPNLCFRERIHDGLE